MVWVYGLKFMLIPFDHISQITGTKIYISWFHKMHVLLSSFMLDLTKNGFMLDALWCHFNAKKILFTSKDINQIIWLQTINEVFFVYAIVRLRLEHLEPITSGFQWHRILLHNQEIAKLANKSTSNKIWYKSW